MVKRTIVDILKKGNVEMFHSAILAWLLDYRGEHGLDRQFLDAFADACSEKGFSGLENALKESLPAHVKTETTGRTGRTDIELQFRTGARFVVENKTKSVASAEQFERYARDGCSVIALGYADVCFPEAVRRSCPVISYRDVYSILRGLNPREDSFGYLVRDYTTYLERETEILTRIQDRAISESGAEWTPLFSTDEHELYDGLHTQNDRRLLQLFFLAGFSRFVAKQRFLNLRAEDWRLNKDQQGGPWLASPLDNSKAQCSRDLAAIIGRHPSVFWLHLQLGNALFSDSAQTPAGEIQLRTGIESGRDETLDALRQDFSEAFSPEPGERRARQGTLLALPIFESDMTYPRLFAKCQAFARRFFAEADGDV